MCDGETVMTEGSLPELSETHKGLCVASTQRKTSLICSSLLLCIIASCLSGHSLAQSEAQDLGLTLRVNAREVILDVLALDSHDHPILDLAAGDLAAFDLVAHKQKIARGITSLRLVYPNTPEERSQDGAGFAGMSISCRLRTTPHYVLAYRPSDENWSSGFHKVVIETRRHGVKLSYQHSYYVGEQEPLPRLKKLTENQIDKELGKDACGSASLPPSIPLRAELLSTGSSRLLRYSLTIDLDSLALVPLAGGGRRVQLDYGACSFNGRGETINFLKSTTDQVISMLDYEQAKAHGLRFLFAFEEPRLLAMTRFVVRDRATGNIGLVSAVPPPDADGVKTESEEDRPLNEPRPSFSVQSQGVPSFPPGPMLLGRRGFFGFILPKANAFCGDVYGGDGSPVGMIFANFLQVPNQPSPNGCMIPGLTCDPAFRVDYRGVFWVRTPGEYKFELTSDDASELEIDDKLLVTNLGVHGPNTLEGRIVLDAGRHSIHVPYYENGEGNLMLELWVHPPGGAWKVFDMRDFATPSSETESHPR